MQVDLSWNVVPDAIYYIIYRGVATGGPYLPVAQSNPASGGATTTYTDGPGNLVNGQDYFYVVSVMTDDGESAYSNEYHAVASTQPASPTGLTGVIT